MSTGNNISRLLQYRQVLINLNELGFETVFSYSLGKEAGVSAEQIRKDFSQFGIKGNRKGGYNINELLFTINGIFRKDEMQKVILIGLGNIGNAMIQYKGFRKNMIQIVAAFDIDPAKYKRKYELPVYPLESMQEVVSDLNVRTAILAIPEREAQQVATLLVQNGIIGILNFTTAVLKVPQHVMVSNIRIGNALETLIYHTCFRDAGKINF
jgi:redox-sensing transcriptional repressor